MKATELRIGNWVNNNGIPIQIENGLCFRKSFIEALSPIPLTPEILEKCGFKLAPTGTHYHLLKFGSYDIIAHNDNEITHPMDVTIYSGGFYRQSFDHIKHLHQLQNLYWCLCGQELDVKGQARSGQGKNC